MTATTATWETWTPAPWAPRATEPCTATPALRPLPTAPSRARVALHTTGATLADLARGIVRAIRFTVAVTMTVALLAGAVIGLGEAIRPLGDAIAPATEAVDALLDDGFCAAKSSLEQVFTGAPVAHSNAAIAANLPDGEDPDEWAVETAEVLPTGCAK